MGSSDRAEDSLLILSFIPDRIIIIANVILIHIKLAVHRNHMDSLGFFFTFDIGCILIRGVLFEIMQAAALALRI